jgi:hypothetical protein
MMLSTNEKVLAMLSINGTHIRPPPLTSLCFHAKSYLGGEGHAVWIFDSYYKGCVELWGRERGLSRASIPYPPSFYMHLKDAPAHREMIEALESRYRAEECSFRTIFGVLEGHRIYAGR